MVTAKAPLFQASKSLFGVMSQFTEEQMEAFVGLIGSSNIAEISNADNKMSEARQAREIIAGSIIQVAHAIIRDNSTNEEKPSGVIHFEKEMNRLLAESGSKRTGNFRFPKRFCVGRLIGDLPIGIIIYATRNHFCHYSDDSLNPVNGVVFDYLRILFEPQNGLSLTHGNDDSLCCYAVIAVLGWGGCPKKGFNKFVTDLTEATNI